MSFAVFHSIAHPVWFPLLILHVDFYSENNTIKWRQPCVYTIETVTVDLCMFHICSAMCSIHMFARTGTLVLETWKCSFEYHRLKYCKSISFVKICRSLFQISFEERQLIRFLSWYKYLTRLIHSIPFCRREVSTLDRTSGHWRGWERCLHVWLRCLHDDYSLNSLVSNHLSRYV